VHVFAPITLPEVAISEEIPPQEKEIFGWNPAYPVNIPAFDSHNRAYFRMRGPLGKEPTGDEEHGFAVYNGDSFEQRKYLAAAAEAFGTDAVITGTNQSQADPRPVFDRDDVMYTTVYVRAKASDAEGLGNWKYVLLESKDYGRTWKAQALEAGIFSYNMEHSPSVEPIPGPPAFLISHLAQGASAQFPFGNYGPLYLQLYERDSAGLLKPGDRVLLTSTGIAAKPHGDASQIVRSGTKIFVTWQEMNLQADATFSPLMVAEYNTVTKELRRDKFLDVVPMNDDHAQPNLLIDSKGVLHLISGSHTGNIYHRYSLTPNEVIGEWSKPVLLNAKATYVAAAIDPQDRIHIVYREQHPPDPSRYGGLDYLTLTYQKYQNGSWTLPKILVDPTQGDYAQYYQQMSLDRFGNIYVYYSHWHLSMPYGTIPGSNPTRINCEPARFPGLLKSEDGGESFFLAVDKDVI
jgi:hypothetical protein